MNLPIPPRVAGVILAGGASTRMGFDKSFATLGGRPLIEHLLERLTPQVARVAISSHDQTSSFSALSVPVLRDSHLDRRGPLAGIAAALNFAEEQRCAAVVVVPTDAPFIPLDLVARLNDGRSEEEVAVAASSRGLEPLFSMWPVTAAARVDAALQDGRLSVLRLIKELRHRVAFFASDERDPFRNLNTQEDLATCARELRG